MKKFQFVTVLVLGLFVCLSLGISSLHQTQGELLLLCEKFNADFTLSEYRKCKDPITMTGENFTFLSQEDIITVYGYIQLDPTRRIQPATAVWFDWISARPLNTCALPTTFDRWRMLLWETPEEKECFNQPDAIP